MITKRRPVPVRDAAAVARAARVVTAQITASAAVIVVLIVAVSVAFVIDQSQPRELLEKPAPGQTKIYVDAGEVLFALVVVGAIAICLAGALSWLIARRAVSPLGEALRIQRSFVADASHELRTPVAVIASRTQILKDQLAAGSDPAENLAALQQDVRVLGEVIGDLLELASSADDPVAAPSPEPRDAVGVIRATVADLQVLAEERRIALVFRVRTDTQDAVVTTVPEPALRRCLVALVDNAIGFSDDGSEIEIAVTATEARFTVAVADHGPGITGIEPARVFDRFAHGAGRSRRGAGIGLSLVWEIVQRHGGAIEVSETSSAGTTMSFTLPRLPAS